MSVTKVLVVAHKTAATPALLEAVRDRAAQGPCTFALLIPNSAHGLHKFVDPEDTPDAEAAATLELALPLMSQAAGSEVEGLIGDAVAPHRDPGRREPHGLRRGHPVDPARARLALAASRPAQQAERPRPARDDDHARRPGAGRLAGLSVGPGDRQSRSGLRTPPGPASNCATASMCGVCGNMSTGRTLRSTYPASTSCAALGASVVGLQLDVDDALGRGLDDPAHDLLRQPGAGRVDHDDVRLLGLLGELPQGQSNVAGEELRVGDLVGPRVGDRVLDRLLDDLESPHLAGPLREHETDRADSAEQVVDALPPLELRVLRGHGVELFGHLGVGLEEGLGADREPQSRDLLMNHGTTCDQLGEPAHRGLAGSVDLRPDERVAVDRRLERRAVELTRRGDEPDLQLAGAATLADDEVAQEADAWRGGRRPPGPGRAPRRAPAPARGSSARSRAWTPRR